MSKIKLNPDSEKVREICDAIKANGGYCPCRIEKIPDTLCMCKEFREQTSGLCHCGLYLKED